MASGSWPKPDPFRQCGEVAEGQNSADVKCISTAQPPFRPPIEMAEGVGFLEKNKSFVYFRTLLAEGGLQCVAKGDFVLDLS